MKDLKQIIRDNDRQALREAFDANHERGRRLMIGDVLDPDGELVETTREKLERREAWLKHKRASKARFWKARS